MKGKNSFLVTIRLKDEIRDELERRASLKSMSIGQYIADCINRSVHTINSESTGTTNHSVHTMSPKEILKQAEIKAGVNAALVKLPYDPETMNRTMDLPIYNAAIHKPGDKVRIARGKRWEAKIVEELDADGHPMPRF